ncbi:ectoine/hydroxyectoine ABC transporter ATP-binding protein EhuA [Rhizobium leguminosarum]|uniref:ectoine/hydroxyectoine ABC transporter ATP-binding protein EhuA n=1 Tax=Rhizobium leguminosarum TaxID=384 RepID=UPI0004B277A7|nr:ectoine/hydroxyectoine ABC transporter ATP-binding protein EhuA [Rhizobium leguminosarum]
MGLHIAPDTSTVKPIIEFRDVGKSYGTFKVLDQLSFSVLPAEHLALIGPSGSGKTTILRILMTLETITAGNVFINGVSLNTEEKNGREVAASEAHLRKVRADIGMVFQHFNLFPHRTALQNVALAPVLTGRMTKAEAKDLALQLLDKVGLSNKAQEYPARLSGGQKQRVAIARALALQPKILLLDEITSALDPELVEEVLNVITDLRNETDMTMLLVTHEMGFARDFADRVLFFEQGKIIEDGPPGKIFQSPHHERTKTFLRKVIAAGQRV